VRSRRPHLSIILRTWILAWLILNGLEVTAADFAPAAREWRTSLSQKILPYWYDSALDVERGGYLLADDREGPNTPEEKQLVTQSRMVWTFAHAHLNGYGDGSRNYLDAARHGYRFLIEHFRDPVNGGYYWKTDLEGRPVNDCKFLYGQGFVVYALIEYSRASGDRRAVRHAMDLYRVVQQHLHDTKHGGWIEHADRSWQRLAAGDPRNPVEVIGLKSANAHLHWMEALAELLEYFFPLPAGRSCLHRRPDWRPVADPESAALSYGHQVEFAWLMVRAEQVLGGPPSWEHFEAHLDHALEYGFDHRRGGLFSRGFDDAPATRTNKVWWAQAEMLAALTDAVRFRPKTEYADALSRLLGFVDAHQADPRDGIWLDTVAADGTPLSTAKAHSWKAGYHDVRAIVKFVDAFGPTPAAGPREQGNR
jgi:mannobiose 2-epimerase